MNPKMDQLSIINGLTQPDWFDKLRNAIERHERILLFVLAMDSQTEARIEELTRAHKYATPRTPTETQWDDCKRKLDLAGYAAKEQGINRTMAYFIEPEDD